jgi:hypothetical protein
MKRNIKRGTLLYKLYLYYSLFFKEKFFLKRNQYSQWGEDIIINNYFKNKIGKYVDIGCFHPIRHNNTCLLYNRGWSGINIDLNPASIDFFNLIRKKDININASISNESDQEKKVYFEHYFSTVNSFYSKHLDNLGVNYTEQIIKTKKFSDIVKTNFDFLNIDCEGEDLKILKSIDFKIYTPKLICVEIDNLNDEIIFFSYLKENGYSFFDKRKFSYLFIK